MQGRARKVAFRRERVEAVRGGVWASLHIRANPALPPQGVWPSGGRRHFLPQVQILRTPGLQRE